MKNMNFQVNLQGVIDLLSNHLYSDPGVFVRELLQNGVDAITARKKLGEPFDESVKVEVFSSYTISFTDSGSGLTEEDIEQFLARIGSSAKRDNLDAADDYIGQFGVGLLACFVVSDEIVLITRSALGGDALEWRGRPDGTYVIKKVKRQVPIGTTVYLKAKANYEEYFEYYRIRGLLNKYGKYLKTPITLTEDKYEQTVNVPQPPYALADCQACEQNLFGEYHFKSNHVKKGLQAMKPILDGKMRCRSIPQDTYAQIMMPLLKQKEYEKAGEYANKAVRLLKDTNQLPEYGSFLEYYTIAKLPKAVEIYNRTIRLALESKVGWDRFHYFLSVGIFLREWNKKKRRIKLAESDRVTPAWLDNEISALAESFNRRNGNDYMSRLMAEKEKDMRRLIAAYGGS